MTEHFAPALHALHTLFQQTSSILQIQFRFAIIGGLAVSTWGSVRATQDIDILADSSPNPVRTATLRERMSRFWGEKGWQYEWRIGVGDDPIPLLTHLVSPTSDQVTADILWAHKQWQRNALKRVIPIRTARALLPVIHPEDLILLKLEAGGPQDILDVEGILAVAPPELDLTRLKRSAARLRLSRDLNRYLQRSRQAKGGV